MLVFPATSELLVYNLVMTGKPASTHVLVLCAGRQCEGLYKPLFDLSGLVTKVTSDAAGFHAHLVERRVDVALLIAAPDVSLVHEVLNGLKSPGSDYRDLPVVLIYPEDTPVEIAVAGLYAGSYDYLIEPFNEIELLTKLAVLAKIKHAEDEFRQLAIKDRLTGLYDRRYLFMRFNEELSRAKRYSRPISCLAIDIDNFRDVNEKSGIDAGDLLLQLVADVLTASKREIDVLARAADDQFVLALYNTDLIGAQVIAGRILGRIHEIKCPFDEEYRVSVSIGLAAIAADQSSTMHAQELQHRAEIACLRAKEAGRNRVTVYRDEMADGLIDG